MSNVGRPKGNNGHHQLSKSFIGDTNCGSFKNSRIRIQCIFNSHRVLVVGLSSQETCQINITHHILSPANNYIFDWFARELSTVRSAALNWSKQWDLRLSLIYKNPSSSRYPTSPVFSQPSFDITALVASLKRGSKRRDVESK